MLMVDGLEVVVARIEERLKTLEVKMDSNQRELLLQVESTRRESDQVTRMSGERLDYITEKVAAARADMETDRKEFKEVVQELAKNVVTKDRYMWVERAVIGVCGLLLTGVIILILQSSLGG